MVDPESPSNIGRFRKGQTGNNKGRPRKAKEDEASAFDVVLDRTFTVMQDGVPRDLTLEELLQQRTLEAALKRSRMAQRKIFKMIDKREKAREAKGAGNWSPVEMLQENVDPENADAALQILGIATRDERRDGWGNKREPLLLELWAVQAGLSRRRGGERLGDREVEELKRCTRDAAKLRWPRGYKE
jgi:hypothetical protein